MQTEQGEVIEGKVTGITNFGAFVALPDGKSGMVHISEVSDGFVRDIGEFLKVGDTVRVTVLNIDERGRISLSVKRAAQSKPDKIRENGRRTDNAESERKPAVPPSEFVPMGRRKAQGCDSFEDMMTKFKADSSERFSDIKRSADSKRSGGYPKPSRKKN